MASQDDTQVEMILRLKEAADSNQMNLVIDFQKEFYYEIYRFFKNDPESFLSFWKCYKDIPALPEGMTNYYPAALAVVQAQPIWLEQTMFLTLFVQGPRMLEKVEFSVNA